MPKRFIHKGDIALDIKLDIKPLPPPPLSASENDAVRKMQRHRLEALAVNVVSLSQLPILYHKEYGSPFPNWQQAGHSSLQVYLRTFPTLAVQPHPTLPRESVVVLRESFRGYGKVFQQRRRIKDYPVQYEKPELTPEENEAVLTELGNKLTLQYLWQVDPATCCIQCKRLLLWPILLPCDHFTCKFCATEDLNEAEMRQRRASGSSPRETETRDEESAACRECGAAYTKNMLYHSGLQDLTSAQQEAFSGLGYFLWSRCAHCLYRGRGCSWIGACYRLGNHLVICRFKQEKKGVTLAEHPPPSKYKDSLTIHDHLARVKATARGQEIPPPMRALRTPPKPQNKATTMGAKSGRPSPAPVHPTASPANDEASGWGTEWDGNGPKAVSFSGSSTAGPPSSKKTPRLPPEEQEEKWEDNAWDLSQLESPPVASHPTVTRSPIVIDSAVSIVSHEVVIIEDSPASQTPGHKCPSPPACSKAKSEEMIRPVEVLDERFETSSPRLVVNQSEPPLSLEGVTAHRTKALATAVAQTRRAHRKREDADYVKLRVCAEAKIHVDFEPSVHLPPKQRGPWALEVEQGMVVQVLAHWKNSLFGYCLVSDGKDYGWIPTGCLKDPDETRTAFAKKLTTIGWQGRQKRSCQKITMLLE